MVIRERTSAAALCGRLLAQSDVRIGGPRPWDIQVRNPAVYRMALRQDMVALGEAYVRGDWDCDAIDELVARMAHEPSHRQFSPAEIWAWASAVLSDEGSRRAAKMVGRRHYDLSPAVFRAMLDRRMTYSCGYWKEARDLDAAQEAKLDLVCRKLDLRPGMKLLDIGGGWGSLVKFAAERYGVEATMVTISREQHEFATASCAGLPVEVQLRDYRDLEGRYDRIASIGMFEHVGPKHYRDYMKVAWNHLAPDGLFLLHCIGSNERGGQQSLDRTLYLPRRAHPGALGGRRGDRRALCAGGLAQFRGRLRPNAMRVVPPLRCAMGRVGGRLGDRVLSTMEAVPLGVRGLVSGANASTVADRALAVRSSWGLSPGFLGQSRLSDRLHI